MQELAKLLIGIGILILGFPIGELLMRKTQEELSSGKRWFKLIAVLSLVGGFTGLVLRNDAVMFSFFFMAIVTSRSFRKDRERF